MAKRQADLDRVVERMIALSGVEDGVQFTVTRGVTRPVWEPDQGTLALYGTAKAVAAEQGIVLTHGSVGGGSTATSPAPWASRRSTVSAYSAMASTPWTSTS